MLVQHPVRITPSRDTVGWRPKDWNFQTVGGPAASMHEVHVTGELVQGAVLGSSGVAVGLAVRGASSASRPPASEVPVAHIHMPLQSVLGAKAEAVSRVDPCEARGISGYGLSNARWALRGTHDLRNASLTECKQHAASQWTCGLGRSATTRALRRPIGSQNVAAFRVVASLVHEVHVAVQSVLPTSHRAWCAGWAPVCCPREPMASKGPSHRQRRPCSVGWCAREGLPSKMKRHQAHQQDTQTTATLSAA